MTQIPIHDDKFFKNLISSVKKATTAGEKALNDATRGYGRTIKAICSLEEQLPTVANGFKPSFIYSLNELKWWRRAYEHYFYLMGYDHIVDKHYAYGDEETESNEFYKIGSGRIWITAYNGKRNPVKDTKGMRYIRNLLASPNNIVNPIELYEGISPSKRYREKAEKSDGGIGKPVDDKILRDANDKGQHINDENRSKLIDQKTIDAIVSEIERLKEQLDEAEISGNTIIEGKILRQINQYTLYLKQNTKDKKTTSGAIVKIPKYTNQTLIKQVVQLEVQSTELSKILELSMKTFIHTYLNQ